MRQIAEGREVLSNQFSAYSLANVHTMKWDSFLKLKGPLYALHVREFYANFSFSNNENISFSLYGRRYSLTLQEFGNVMKVPSKGLKFFLNPTSFDEFPNWMERDSVLETLCNGSVQPNSFNNEGLLSLHLSPQYDLWQQVITMNVYGKGEKLWRLNSNEVTLLWCLSRSFEVNIAYFMASRMQDAAQNPLLSLPYGFHLTKLFTCLGLTLSLDFATQIFSPPISRASVRTIFESSVYDSTNFISQSSQSQHEAIHRNTMRIGRLLLKLDNTLTNVWHFIRHNN